ncbi:uncharacterized protein Gasu_41390 [Galdieria sulphuraria]|uniref:Uncharacterized protein n=1 Tax=Galdieria sulphuraria TaxID=130081 RepID=M2WWR3_GALSU|nr:uncharacterized protein Gasu_41390 [Galdieria sulphuraria]EME28450.1 hypothetical protein Gasu_41390 [Galdieria sulphuraria]|eukprot:XP_005704970.1 hypothetical protein Gasu_41390 [Galdieria sulphuraria]
MAIFKSTQSPLDWPSSPISSNPFPHPFSPIAISPPISNYPFFPSPPQWQFPKHDHLCGWPKLAPFPTHFPLGNFPTLSHFLQFTHSSPAHHNGNFQINAITFGLSSVYLDERILVLVGMSSAKSTWVNSSSKSIQS